MHTQFREHSLAIDSVPVGPFHNDVRTTMIHAHVPRRGGQSVKSPGRGLLPSDYWELANQPRRADLGLLE